MSETKRIKILETEYKDEEDLVYWKINILDEDKLVKIAMRAKELLDGMGIVGDVTKEEMNQFLSDIKGKEINWTFDVKIKDVPKVDENNAEQIASAIDEYPFPEVFSAERREIMENEKE